MIQVNISFIIQVGQIWVKRCAINNYVCTIGLNWDSPGQTQMGDHASCDDVDSNVDDNDVIQCKWEELPH